MIKTSIDFEVIEGELLDCLYDLKEAGATERLSFVPSDEAVMERVVSLFGSSGLGK